MRSLIAALLLLCAVPAYGFNFDWGGSIKSLYVDLVQSLSWVSTAYDFGSVNVGESAYRRISVVNSGNDTAEGVTVKVAAPFALCSTAQRPAFGNISASRTRYYSVRATPTGAGAFGGPAFGSYTAPNIARVSVALSGTGVAVAGTDSTPNAFTFTDQTAVALSSTITSAPITIAGIDTTSAISVTGGTYDINGSGTFTASAGTVSNGNTVRAQHTSSGSNSTPVDTIVTIGGVTDTFSSTTLAGGVASIPFYLNADSVVNGQTPQKGTGTVTVGAGTTSVAGAVGNAWKFGATVSGSSLPIAGNLDVNVGTIGFYLNATNWGSAFASLFHVEIATLPYWRIGHSTSSGALQFSFENQVVSIANASITGTNFIEFTWDRSNGLSSYRLNGGTWAAATSTATTAFTAHTTMDVGPITNVTSHNIWIDQIIISNAYQDANVYANRNSTGGF